MKIGFIQMDLVYANPQKNLELVEARITNMMQKSVDVIVIPEMWNTSYALEEIKDIADEDGKNHAAKIGNLAKKFKVNIIAGSVSDRRESKIYNTSYIYNREGQNIARYSKVHLFQLMDEHKYLARGEKNVPFDIDGITCGIIICYDLRFPELTRSLALNGAKIIFVVAQWPNPRFNHWSILNKARAIENQLYFVSVNRVGCEKDKSFFGHSMVLDPWGEVIYEAGEQEDMKVVEVIPEKVDEVRRKIPCFQDRVEDVY